MSFNKQFQKPAQATTSTSTSPSKGFMLPSLSSSQPVVGSSKEPSMGISTTTTTLSPTNSPTKTRTGSAELINYLEKLGPSPTPDSAHKQQSSNPNDGSIPTLVSLLGNSNDSRCKPKARELISAMTYEGEGTLLDEGDSPSSDEDDEDEDDESLQEKKAIDIVKTDESDDSGIADDLTGDKQDPLIELNDQEEFSDNVPQPITEEKEETVEEQPTAKLEKTPTNPDEFGDFQEASRQSYNHRAKTAKREGAPKDRSSIKSTGSIPNPPKPTKQLAFDFQKFLRMFKTRQCEPAHKYLRSFLSQFNQKNWTLDEQSKLIADFEKFLYHKLLQLPPFEPLSTDAEFDNVKEGIEKLVMTRTYNSTFSPVVPKQKRSEQHKDDLSKDRKYNEQIKLYSWIELKHLDIPMNLNVESNFVKLAATEINKINNYKSPRDKIICILNCCKIIFGLIRQQQKQKKIEENADSFVPLLIYVLIQSQPKFLYSNLMYIERFRSEDFLVGETSYYVSTLQIAVNFVIDLEFDKLTISQDDYDTKLNQAKHQLAKEQEERKKELIQKQQESAQQNPLVNVLSQNDLLAPIPKKITELIVGSTSTPGSSSSNETPSQVLTKSAELMKQSFSNSLSNFFSSPSPPPVQRPPSSTGTTTLSYKEELQTIKKLSLEANEIFEKRKQQEEENFKVLVSMFPNLDQDIIKDVLVTSSTETDGAGNIGDCVDALLVLSND